MTAGRDLRAIRQRKPLVHQITNYVVMNETANATLALGALPVMAHAPEEVEEMVGLAGALVLNIGTLSPHWVEAMLAAGRGANELGVPVEMVSGQKPSATIGTATRQAKLAPPWPTSKRTPRVRPSDRAALARPEGASSPRRPE